MNKDFEEFIKDISWFINQTDKIDFLDNETEIALTEKFRDTFPVLSNLISQARILTFTINNQLYKLFSWTNKDGLSCGWLNKIEQNTSSTLPLIDEHKLLLSEIGGIQESYNQPDPSLSNKQNFMFVESECSLGINDWDDFYEELCEDENVEPINYKNFVCFVVEANGGATTYNPETKEIFLFSRSLL